MKKVVSILLCLIIVVGFAACGTSETPAEESPVEATTEVSAEPTPEPTATATPTATPTPEPTFKPIVNETMTIENLTFEYSSISEPKYEVSESGIIQFTFYPTETCYFMIQVAEFGEEADEQEEQDSLIMLQQAAMVNTEDGEIFDTGKTKLDNGIETVYTAFNANVNDNYYQIAADSFFIDTTLYAVTFTQSISDTTDSETNANFKVYEDFLNSMSIVDSEDKQSEEDETKSKEINSDTGELTTGKRNALKRAQEYLKNFAFSEKGIADQLKYEEFTDEEIEYAIDNLDENWNEHAAKAAKNYMDLKSFSRKGLIDQLKYEGFTTEQAEYGADSVGL